MKCFTTTTKTSFKQYVPAHGSCSCRWRASRAIRISSAVSLTGETVRRETSVSGPKDKTKLAMLSFRRTLGPGVNWTLNGMWAKYDGATAGTSDDNKGYAVTSSIKLNF